MSSTIARKLFFVAVLLGTCIEVRSTVGVEIQIARLAALTVDSHLGEGSAVSADGRFIAYVGKEGLHLWDVSNGRDRVLLHEIGSWIDVFTNPTFTPDGRSILVSASGGTYYYPSDIYSIDLVTLRVHKLTRSKARPLYAKGHAIFEKYFYSALMSPTSDMLLISFYDVDSGQEGVLLRHKTTSQFKVVDTGEPLGWNRDGSAFYYKKTGKLISVNSKTGNRTTLFTGGSIVGTLRNGDVTAVDDGTDIVFVRSSGQWSGREKSNISRSILLRDGAQLEELQLKSLHAVRGDIVLLDYQKDSVEHLELVRVSPTL